MLLRKAKETGCGKWVKSKTLFRPPKGQEERAIGIGKREMLEIGEMD